MALRTNEYVVRLQHRVGTDKKKYLPFWKLSSNAYFCQSQRIVWLLLLLLLRRRLLLEVEAVEHWVPHHQLTVAQT